jgi:hypothetical protein
MDLDTRITYMGLRAFNFLYDVGKFIGKITYQSLSDFSSYMGGRYNQWLFLEGDIGPLPDSVIKNRSITNIVWFYDVSKFKLTHSHNIGLQVTSTHPFLTASIRVGNIEYDMDEFINNFKWISNATVYPTCRLMLHAWSIHSGIWLSRNDNPILRVITHEGEQVDITIFGDNDTIWHRVLLGTESDSDSNNDADSEGSTDNDESSTTSDSAEQNETSQAENDESKSDESNEENTSDITTSTFNDRNRIDLEQMEVIDVPVSSM